MLAINHPWWFRFFIERVCWLVSSRYTWWQLPDLSCLTHEFPSQDFSDGESNVILNVQHTRCMGRCNMQVRNEVFCDVYKGSLYISNTPPLVVEHAFPLTEFVGSLIALVYSVEKHGHPPGKYKVKPHPVNLNK